MKRTFLFHHLLLLICFSSLAQVAEIIPPSPNAASLGQYGEVPVNYHTGVPNISIPLYTITSDDIQVPISLSFHASGHKVGTTASWVGLGWSLNAGGTVSRSLKGRPDESGFFYNIEEIQRWKSDSLLSYLGVSQESGTPGDPITDLKARMRLISDRKDDVEADIFFYNFSGKSGKFAFASDRSIVQLPYKDLKITPLGFNDVDNIINSGSINGFEIISEDGIKYNFDDGETSTTTRLYESAGTPETYNSAWNLTSINSQKSGRQVDFHYTSENLTYDPIYGQTHTFAIHSVLNNGIEEAVSGYSMQTTMEPKYLDSITWMGGSIIFYRSDDRNDLPSGGQQLDSIVIFNSMGDMIKTYHLEYAPFTLQASEDQYLELISVTEIGADGIARNPHEFEYYPGVPSRDSKSIDHLGFYNGKPNSTIIPTYTNPLGALRENANRDPGNNTSKVGMLRHIHYPFGGHTEFVYEANDYSISNTDLYIPEDQWVDVNLGNVTAEACHPNGNLVNGTFPISGFLCNNADTVFFTTPENMVRHEISFSVLVDSSTAIDPTNFYINIFEQTSSGNTLVRAFHSSSDLTLSDVLEPAKDYEVHAYNTATGSSIWANINYSYAPENIYTSGIRIAQIKNDDDNGMITTTKYSYRLKSDSSKSSGFFLANEPDYEQNYVTNLPNLGSYDYQVISAHPTGYLGYLTEAHVIYSEVEVEQEGNGSIRYYYTTFQDTVRMDTIITDSLRYFGVDDYDHTLPDEVSNFWKRGHLYKQEIMNSQGELIREENNYYSYQNKDTTHSFQHEFRYKIAESGNSWWDAYSVKYDTEVTGWARLDSSKTVSYELDKLVENTTNYEYDPNSPLLLPRHITQNKETPEEVKETISYLDDRVNHVISPMTGKVTRANGKHVNFEKHTYSVDHKLTKIEHLDSLGNVKRYQDLAEHNGVKPSLVTQHTGIEQYVLWGYDGDLPVAVVSPKPHILQDTVSAIAQYAFSGSDDPGSVAADIQYLKDKLAFFMSNPNYEVQLFTHKPLVGITSQTDTNGKTTYYRYDTFGRLEAVLDQDQNFLKKYTYTEKAN